MTIKTASELKKQPTAIIVVGMAGSGKSTFVHRMCLHLESDGRKFLAVNLDPAAAQVSYPADIDIRDTINYKDIMSKYQLGPNGAIMTGLNIYAARFDEVLKTLDPTSDSESEEPEFLIFDTPGQIEVFSWSASGQIISELLALTYPTVMVYVVDSSICKESPVSFVSNMTYACSMMLKSALPFVIAFNKVDETGSEFADEWMKDFDKLLNALELNGRNSEYMSGFSRSLVLALDEFYSSIPHSGVSSLEGTGFNDMIELILKGRTEYFSDVLPALAKRASRLSQTRATPAVDRRPPSIRNQEEEDLRELELLRSRNQKAI